MIPPEPPVNEPARIALLEELEILDTLPEQAYDDIVAVAAHISGAPIALVSLVDADRQWFKARVGLDATETSREVSFCGHVVQDGHMLIVSDATEDERFHDNPLVTGDPSIRFYAGAPLVTSEGYAVGTLCVIDRQARQLGPEQVELLQRLGRQVVLLLEERLQRQALARALDEAERASHAKSRFMANMSHELRTPLNSVIGFADILAKDKHGHLDERERTFVERIGANGRHLLGLINDVLDLSKVEAGQMEVRMGRHDVAELARGVVEQLRGTLGEHEHRLRLCVPEQGPAMAEVDPRRLHQVLLNLVANGLKFSGHGCRRGARGGARRKGALRRGGR